MKGRAVARCLTLTLCQSARSRLQVDREPERWMEKFEGSNADHYDSDIIKRVPGYTTLQDLSAALLTELLPASADLLVVGAGTGAELERLAALNPDWRFAAVDPSPAMLDRARRRLSPSAAARVTWLADTLDTVPASRIGRRFDGAVSLLVSHFLADRGEKQSFFSSIAMHLEPAAPLVTAELFAPADASFGPASLARWARIAGLDPDAVAIMEERVRQLFHPVDADRFAILLENAGFAPPKTFFEALQFRGSLTRKMSAC